VSACSREQGVEDFADDALAGARELAHAFELLLNLRRRPALDVAVALAADQFLGAGVERVRERRKGGGRHALRAVLVGGTVYC